ncbi:MAG TPA: LCP family protein [Chloroflexia bacterium]|nr:LCP family protein [Chloroflexia bacterium]
MANAPAAGQRQIPAAPLRRRAGLPRWARLLLVLLGLGLVGVFGFAGNLGFSAWKAMNSAYRGPLPTLAPQTEVPALPAAGGGPTPRPGEPTWTPGATATADAAEELPAGRTNILVLGTDKRAELGTDAARSDTLIIISVDPQWKTAGILSIPRDLQVPLPPYGLQKINAAYFFGEYNKLPGGGATLAVPTVSKFFQVPIQYYVAINFEGFQKVIDTIGGIDVYVPDTIDDPEYPGPYNSYIHVHFDAGCQHLDGEHALQYARTRHADSDFGRARRQQQVIRAVREKALTLNMLPRYTDLLGQLGDSIETNIPPEQQLAFAQLGGEIKGPDIYTAQIDNTMVRVVDDTGALALRWDRAKPMLDWFFGRGAYKTLRPGTILTPTAVPTFAEEWLPTQGPAVLQPPLPTAPPAGVTPPAGLPSSPSASVTAPPLGSCR